MSVSMCVFVYTPLVGHCVYVYFVLRVGHQITNLFDTTDFHELPFRTSSFFQNVKIRLG